MKGNCYPGIHRKAAQSSICFFFWLVVELLLLQKKSISARNCAVNPAISFCVSLLHWLYFLACFGKVYKELFCSFYYFILFGLSKSEHCLRRATSCNFFCYFLQHLLCCVLGYPPSGWLFKTAGWSPGTFAPGNRTPKKLFP